ncbi:hypothetical protein FQA39_LY12647 [Lamprigera yunnana]|nr:hypothetical protein FQA39_LY12647 [Lamprigera yunnana]
MSETATLNEQLIEVVKKYPFLFNKPERDYKNTVKKSKTWEEIVVKLHLTGGEDACKKWKSLRDRYARELKKLSDLKGTVSYETTLNITKELSQTIHPIRFRLHKHLMRQVAQSLQAVTLPFVWKKSRAHQWNTAHHLAPAILIVPPAERCQKEKHLKILIPTLWRLLLLLGRCALP